MKMLFVLFLIIHGFTSYATDMKELIKLVAENSSYSDPTFTEKHNVEIKNQVIGIYQKAYDESQKKNSKSSFNGYTPNDLYPHYRPIVQKLYTDGYIRLDHLDAWDKDFNSLNKLKANDGVDKYSYWRKQYEDVFNSLFSNVKASPATCANQGENSTAKKCCQGLISFKDSFNFFGQKRNGPLQEKNQCVSSGQSCQVNQDCCSSVCHKDNPNEAGTCAQKMACYQIHEYGQACGNPSPFCAKGECSEFTKNITGLVECQNPGNKCESNNECCSNLCENKKCVKNLRCLSCRKDGLLKNGESCCDGYINLKGRCVPPVLPLVPSVKIKNILEIILHNIFPHAYAATETSNEKELSNAQKLALDSQRENCNNPDINKDLDVKTCLEKVERLKTGYTKDRYTGLTTEQNNDILEKRATCSKNNPTTITCSDCEGGSKLNPRLSECMQKVDVEEKEILLENEKNGIKGISLNKEEYLNEYAIPGVTALTYSDMKTCKFNAYNDSWRDSSTRERNAELFLRSFEYVYSNKGAEDFWEEGNRGNIFTRAKKVAVRFRENRKRYIENMKKIDEEMSCKCMAISGVDKFSAAQQDYFSSNCEEYNAELRQSLGDDLNKVNDKLAVGSSKIDGTTINSLSSKKEKDISKIEEVDKGAIGISQERLLIDFLNLKADAQVARFTDNSDLEVELTELSDYIKNKDFTEVFKDKIQGGVPRVQNNMAGNSHGLYGWGYEYTSDWAIVVGAIVTGGATLMFSSQREAIGAMLGFNSNGRSGANHSMATLESFMEAAWGIINEEDPSIAPEVYDNDMGAKSFNLSTSQAQAFKRYFVGPRYVNTEAIQNKCEVMGRASACVRSAYIVPFDESGYVNFLLDPTLPLFVNGNIISTNGMPLSGGGSSHKSWVDYINEASEAGVTYLKTTQGGRPSGSLEKWGGTWEFKGETFRYNKASTSFGERDVLTDALKEGYFLPERGSFIPEEFGNRKNAIMEGAKIYALCKNLKSCGANDLDAGEIGFGFLFQSEEEARDFAKYTYDIHYEWSHLTKNNYLGYPAAGLDQYFKLVAYNMKLAGSLAASRSIQASEAVDLYTKDFNARLGNYSSFGEAALGAPSRNIKFKAGFYKILGKLNFQGKSNLSEFKSVLSKELSAGRLSQGEIAALKAAESNALLRNRDITEKEDFEKALASTSNDTKNLVAKNSESLNKINNPLAQFSLAKLGGGTNGFKKLNNSLSDLNNQINAANKEEGSSKNSQSYTSFSPPTRADYGGQYGGSSTSNSYTDSVPSNSLSNQNDSGFDQRQIVNLIQNLQKEDLDTNEFDSLFNVVSKAYRRNYSKLLNRKLNDSELESKLESNTKNKNKMEDRKEELKKLLTK